MKGKRASAEEKKEPQFGWRNRYAVYILALLLALAMRWWLTPPQIPRPDLGRSDPELIRVIDEAQAAVRAAPRSAAAWGELGLLLSAHRYAEQAEACFDRASELDLGEWRWLYAKALSQAKEHPNEAIATLRDALVRDSDALPARVLRGELCALLGKSDEAEKQFREALNSSPDDARAQLGLARLLFAQEEFNEALELLEQTKNHPSARKASYELIAQIQRRKGDDAARRVAAQARALPDDAPWPLDPIGTQIESLRVGKTHYLKRITELRAAGDVEQANALSQEAEKRYPELYLLVEASLRMERGDAAGAEQALQEALEHDPDSLDAQFELSKALAAQNKRAQAKQTLRELLRREPSYGPAWLQLGRISGDEPQEAIAALETAVQYMPLNADVHEALAEQLKTAGRHSEATVHASYAERLRDRNRAANSP